MLIGTQQIAGCQNRQVDALAKIRQEWELTTEGECLIDIDASVGLLLADIVVALGLTPMEMILVLGQKLASELKDIFPPSEILQE